MAASSRSRFLDRSKWLPTAAPIAEGEAQPGFEYSLVHRAVFAYDPLMADETHTMLLKPGNRILSKRPGVVEGYHIWSMALSATITLGNGATVAAGPLPGALAATGPEAESVQCDGLLLERLQPAEMRAIDALMNRQWDRIVVRVRAENGYGGHEEVEALMYVCPPRVSEELLDASRPWSYTDFRKTHLSGYLEQVVAPCREQFEQDEMLQPPPEPQEEPVARS